MYSPADIRVVHLEITENCNAACPQCPRRIDGGRLNEKITLAELSLDDIQKILPDAFVRQLGKIYLCGNYGDPAAAADTLNVLRYFRSVNPTLRLGLHSNGSLRSENWWRSLAGVIGGYGYARFAIDGLEDTNALYRRFTSWPKIIANAGAYIAAGGRAEWDFLVFAHNEHQVEEARELAATMGFAAFNVKRTARFLERSAEAYAAQSPVRDRSGATVTVLERPKSRDYQSPELLEMAVKLANFSSFDEYLGQREIHCKAQAEKSIYISAEGKIFPCCWLGQMQKNPDGAETRDAARRFGGIFADATLDGKLRTIESIVADDFFTSQVPQGIGGAEKTKICSRVCGK
jgi:MoaA/NifB/PqqE/SkfB family radical SAM enzyme